MASRVVESPVIAVLNMPRAAPASVTKRPKARSQTDQNLATQSSKLPNWSRMFTRAQKPQNNKTLLLLVTLVYQFRLSSVCLFPSFSLLLLFFFPLQNCSLLPIFCFLAVVAPSTYKPLLLLMVTPFPCHVVYFSFKGILFFGLISFLFVFNIKA